MTPPEEDARAHREAPAPATKLEPIYVLAIHGGAGTITPENMTPELEAEYREVLASSLQAGKKILESGGDSVDAVEAAIVVMEDSPVFNAGKGAVYTHEATHELDASIMVGEGRKAGAVAAVRTVKNPIRAARAVMDMSPHVMLTGAGADAFANSSGLEVVEQDYFGTERRKEQLERAIQSETIELDHGGGETKTEPRKPAKDSKHRNRPDKFGTVGAVALDRHGHLAAGTSTGGMTNKRHGRVGDSPIIGAGTYADDSVAVSCTGHGEYFIRYSVAHEIAARVRHGKIPLADAAAAVIDELHGVGGSGGVIAVDRHGNAALPFNTKGMYRGRIDASGEMAIEIYGK